jgi:hypothetical protein
MNLKYQLVDLPGERWYRDWRMNIGISMSDIDDIVGRQGEEMVDYEYSQVGADIKAYALLEMKHWHVSDETIVNAVCYPNAVKHLADLAKLPYFVVKYYPKQECSHWKFEVHPGNKKAVEFFKSDQSRVLSEAGYVHFLMQLRGSKMPAEYLKKTYSTAR